MQKFALSAILLGVFGIANASTIEAGSWTAHFTGADHGNCSIKVTAEGALTGICHGADETKPFPVAGVVKGSHVSFGVAATGAEFTGTIGANHGSGVWVNHGVGGKWTLDKR
ncbi:MAG: hypothetical protein JJ714_07535 [Acidithiobacillus sp.]|nr:hypothetical protein [Acidithiobacillus sp.]